MSELANTSGRLVTNALIEKFERDQKEIDTETALWKLNDASEIAKRQLKEHEQRKTVVAGFTHREGDSKDDGGGVGGSLEAQIRSLPIASLRRNHAQALRDWADTDTAVRLAARRVLSEFEVDGDSCGVPMIEDIVDLLVARLEAVAGAGVGEKARRTKKGKRHVERK